jgi:hypothetical protein
MFDRGATRINHGHVIATQHPSGLGITRLWIRHLIQELYKEKDDLVIRLNCMNERIQSTNALIERFRVNSYGFRVHYQLHAKQRALEIKWTEEKNTVTGRLTDIVSMLEKLNNEKTDHTQNVNLSKIYLSDLTLFRIDE